MRLQVYCHVFTGAWAEPLGDLISAFNTSGLSEVSPTLRLGIVGPEVGRQAVLKRLGMCKLEPEIDVYARLGNEALTINAIRHHVREDPKGAVLYCHTKGSARPIELNRRWRRAMIKKLIMGWSEAASYLEDHHAVGPFWIPQRAFFGGNFWMARNDYLISLPECLEEPRDRAEEWIGLGNPKIYDVLSGYPDYEYFGLPSETPPY